MQGNFDSLDTKNGEFQEIISKDSYVKEWKLGHFQKLIFANKLKEMKEVVMAYALGILSYKNLLLNRIKDSENVPEVRMPVGFLYAKGCIKKWLKENEISVENLPDKPFQASLTKLPNEIVLEIDIDDKEKREKEYRALKKALYKLGIDKYLVIFSGSKSLHYHIFIRPDGLTLKELEYLKTSLADFISFFIKIDRQVTHMNLPARMPFTWHPDTGNLALIVYPSEMAAKLIDLLSAYKFDEIKRFLIFNVPNYIKSLEVFPKVFNKWLEEFRAKQEEKRKTSYARFVKGKLPKLYNSILNEVWADGKKRMICLLFCLAKKIGIKKEQFEKDVKEWIEKQNWRRNSDKTICLGILRCYLRWWDNYNWSWYGFLKKHLLGKDFDEKDKMLKILESLNIKIK